jgi:hypothetical protein
MTKLALRIVMMGALAGLLASCAPRPLSREELDATAPLNDLAARRGQTVLQLLTSGALAFSVPPATVLDTVIVDSAGKTVAIRFSKHLAYPPYRERTVARLYDSVRAVFGPRFAGFAFSVEARGRRVEEFVPNFYRSSPARIDSTRLAKPDTGRVIPVIRRVNIPWEPSRGLQGRNIVVSPSHGWYFAKDRDRWRWQRPRLFQSVEDLIPLSFTLLYLVPMLEQSGATVFVPRERDTQTHEVVVDNDVRPPARRTTPYTETPSRGSRKWMTGIGPGWGPLPTPYVGNENPFVAGSHAVARATAAATHTATWVPEIPEAGDYAVYVSWVASDSNVTDAHYNVAYDGGVAEFLVNQRIGGSTWEYLGTFHFRKGANPDVGKVTLTNASSEPGRLVSADAVRFGGGMGMIARKGRESGRPRFAEGARYYLQYAGMPDTLVYTITNNNDDYRDDYVSRPEYANYLRGAPFGPNKNKNVKGLGIPVDLCLSFHTDAGITHNDTSVGTLAIYCTTSIDSQSVFPDSVSRMANRDLADLVQTQLVEDVRSLFDPAWSRRDLWDADYAEAARPLMPSLLLEALSHQNFLDMRFVQDPRFRFAVARAIYKGILRFLATYYGVPSVVAPLPVTHFSAVLTGPNEATLRWRPTVDSLEPEASAKRYVVYTREGEGGFDRGLLVDTTTAIVRNLRPGVIYGFKVCAVNDGGESFPSEILAVCRARSSAAPVLVMNCFDRVGPPAWVETSGFSGFINLLDDGVSAGKDFSFTGEQFDFDPDSRWRTDDGPGHGASMSDREASVITGNTFDFVVLHGKALRDCGLSFSSSSRDAVLDSTVTLDGYRLVDVLLGKQRASRWPKAIADSLRGTQYAAFPPRLQGVLRDYAERGGKLLVTGAYVGTDLLSTHLADSTTVRFAAEVLRLTWATDHASRTGRVYSPDSLFVSPKLQMQLSTTPTATMYGVAAPDAINPINGARTLLRYDENQFSAAIGDANIVVMGFPFEAIVDPSNRLILMEAVLKFLKL